ncbi:MAG: NYN domain-containing protein, partial [Oscillospiraceae bacterium]|nr:NYN domain-containing protein [Oscillospiraceae bacterium]
MSFGILAPVDAGKTTLSEALLFEAGAIRSLGRVDRGDAFLDNDAIERRRGITVFSRPALMELGDLELTLIDTPGHRDFSCETERAISVMDYAVLLISASDGVVAHTLTLWRLLRRAGVPTFIFVNKTDLPGFDRRALLTSLRTHLGDRVWDAGSLDEAAAGEDEEAMELFLAGEQVPAELAAELIARERLFPVFFGSALKGSGVKGLLEALQKLTLVPERPEELGLRFYKISRDGAVRLSWARVTGGTLKVKSTLDLGGVQEKCDSLRLYSGEKFRQLQEARAGDIIAITGPVTTFAGQSFGSAGAAKSALVSPVLRTSVTFPAGTDPSAALRALRTLEEEDPSLRVEINEVTGIISVMTMGEVQEEVLRELLARRFSLEAEFGQGEIVYLETIENTVEGVGHFEPLRHYAEVHLIMSPGERGSGLVLASQVPEDRLDRNWQRLILTHLEEKRHLGVLTGSPITDMRITLAAGRAHLKHTEGGDFRQATYRAVRQGLMQAKSVLLEPWISFDIRLPREHLGRAMSDMQRLCAQTRPPEDDGVWAVLSGRGPLSELRGYQKSLTAYTRGQGTFQSAGAGYAPCHNAAQVIEAIGYDPERDTENPASSVFCAHGAGVVVDWREVPAKMHLESVLRAKNAPAEQEASPSERPRPRQDRAALDKELMDIFIRTYGGQSRDMLTREERRRREGARKELREGKYEIKKQFAEGEYLLVDGYNIIFAWEELKTVARQSLDAARKLLSDIMANYRGLRGGDVILVYDAYKVSGGTGSVTDYCGISIVYTREAETADSYIERTAHELGKKHRVRVATSDGPEQMIILGSGALRLTADELHQECREAEN